MEGFFQVWAYLEEQPLLWLTVTVTTYALAQWLFATSRRFPLLNPVLIAVVATVLLLLATDTSYDTYFEGAQFVHFLLGPVTVLLAIPLYEQLPRLQRQWLPIVVALGVGSVTAIGSAVAIGYALGLGPTTLLSLMPKSATTPIAIGVAEKLGGEASLTAVFVIMTGITVAVAGIPLLRLIGERDGTVKGFAMGVAGHGIATARAFQHGQPTGAYAGLGMGLNATLTALLAPLVAWLLGL
ncbi:LrgB family protein [Spiribacter vilamensis]|uniref:Putative murein hydrolase (TIGR00659 family) n=1 Tax=Spiribacter vilamensis TaxID=531306 RepID=A0A4Q8D248_9GAMM|nr:LrgB family protein [Spiribacter vilamensis]RZU99449.1 putative murein hydrolase (TIGR00659 family) [Spiribacter vilamensis]TVO61579.1 LrgB family protein [Spiribacter vilamensis]